MTQLLEDFTGPEIDGNFVGKCIFDHEATVHDKQNVLTWENEKSANDAGVLGAMMRGERDEEGKRVTTQAPPGESEFVIDQSIELTSGDTLPVKFAAHHLIPGDASWPKSNLSQWIDKRGGKVDGDVGYNVNRASNGIWLPGNYAFRKDGPSWSERGKVDKGFQWLYASEVMGAFKRQFHDSHVAYSEAVLGLLNKVATKVGVHCGGNKGCDAKDCPAKAGGRPPPYGVLDRIASIESRLRARLTGAQAGWKGPFITSSFALMHARSLKDRDVARAELSAMYHTLREARAK